MPATTGIIAYATVIFFSTFLILFGIYTVYSRWQAIKVEKDALTDLRARDVNHLIDKVPKCIVCFPGLYPGIIFAIFWTILQ